MLLINTDGNLVNYSNGKKNELDKKKSGITKYVVKIMRCRKSVYVLCNNGRIYRTKKNKKTAFEPVSTPRLNKYFIKYMCASDDFIFCSTGNKTLFVIDRDGKIIDKITGIKEYLSNLIDLYRENDGNTKVGVAVKHTNGKIYLITAEKTSANGTKIIKTPLKFKSNKQIKKIFQINNETIIALHVDGKLSAATKLVKDDQFKKLHTIITNYLSKNKTKIVDVFHDISEVLIITHTNGKICEYPCTEIDLFYSIAKYKFKEYSVKANDDDIIDNIVDIVIDIRSTLIFYSSGNVYECIWNKFDAKNKEKLTGYYLDAAL
jgi:alpha-tubulin suppressor-like RCC1 family protein